MKQSFLLTPEARNDLKQIFLDIAENNPDSAQRLRVEFEEAIQALGRSPGTGHYNDDLLSRNFRFENFYSYAVL